MQAFSHPPSGPGPGGSGESAVLDLAIERGGALNGALTRERLGAGPLPELDPAAFGRYVRLKYGAALEALRLDIEYTHAAGDYLSGRRGERQYEVLDLVGGYGSLLFGHNHPEIVATAVAALQAGRPVYTRGSNRTAAGTLGAALSQRVGAACGAEYGRAF